MRESLQMIAVMAFILFGIAGIVHAGNWLRNCDSTQVMASGDPLNPGQMACYKPTTINDDSVLIDLDLCENADVFYLDNADGDSTVSTTTANLRICGKDQAATSAGCFAIENVTLDGDETTDTEAIYGFAGTSVYLDLLNDGANPEEGQFDLRCNP